MEEQILDEFNETPKHIDYVGLTKRFNASLLDSLIIAVFAFGLNYLMAGRGIPALAILPVVVDLLYKVVLEKEFGQTIGKKAVGITVVNENLRKISWQQSLVRNYYYVIGTVIGLIQYYYAYQYQGSEAGLSYTDSMLTQLAGPMYLNYVNYALMIGFVIDCLRMSKSEKNQTMHDTWANTYVVRESFLIK